MNTKIPIDSKHPPLASPSRKPSTQLHLRPYFHLSPTPPPDPQDSALASHQDPEITPVTGLAHDGLLGLVDNYSGSHDEGPETVQLSGDHQMVGLGALDLQETVLID